MYAPHLSHIHDDKIAFSNNISSEATGPFGLIFHIKHLSKGGIKICVIYANPLFKMAARSIYGKSPSEIIFIRSAEGIRTKFSMKHVGTVMIIYYDFHKVWITNAPAIAYRMYAKNCKKW